MVYSSLEVENRCVVCQAPAIGKKGTMYCSRRCASIAWRNKHYPYTYLNCKFCGGSFRRLTSSQAYCSPDCQKSAERDRKKVIDGPGKQWAKGKTFANHVPDTKCDLCGVMFFKRDCYKSRGNKTNFCSQECRVTYMAIHPEQFPQSSSRRGRGGKRDDLGGMYFRSSWEANYARYLNWLISIGEIFKWEYEPDTYEFPVKRGSRFYTPDFKVFNNDNSVDYHEIKGYMDPRSATKLKRMAKYYPEIKVILISKDEYYSIQSVVSSIVPGWEKRR